MNDLLEAEQPTKLKAADIRAALRRRFSQPECVIVFEVAQATGFAAHRHLDAVAMDLWPSRGLALHGIEIKVNRADWRREKANPAKAEQIARFCDRFWVAAPTALIPLGELPPAWGLIEVDGKGRTATTKLAEKTSAEPVSREFLAAMLRAAGRAFTEDDATAALGARAARLEEQFQKRVEDRARSLTEQNIGAAANWNALVRALGEDPGVFWGADRVVRAVKIAMSSGLASSWGGLHQLRRHLGDMADQIDRAITEFAVPDQESKG